MHTVWIYGVYTICICIVSHLFIYSFIHVCIYSFIHSFTGVRLVKAKSAMSLFEKKHRHEIGNFLSLCNIIGTLYHDD